VKNAEKFSNHLAPSYGLRSVEHRDGGAGGEFLQYALGRSALLHQSAYVLCGDWHLARDVVRETLLKVYLHWPRLRQARDPDGYVRRIMLAEARLIAWPAASCPPSPGAFAAAPGTADGVARRDGVAGALLELPFHERATVAFRYLEGLSQAETAEILGCSERVVKRRSYRALAALRKVAEAMP
jgi:DNA-directed RNA polymerase specialized sigma24 family protein